MKIKSILFLLIFLPLPIYATENGLEYDNLSVTHKTIAGTKLTIKEDQPGVYTLHYTELNNKYILMLSLYPYNTKTFKLDDLKKTITERGNKVLPMSVEKDLVIRDIIKDGATVGYNYALTDKNPQKGEHKHLVQGLVKYNRLLGYYTFLYNNPGEMKILRENSIESIIQDNLCMNKTKYFEHIKFSERDIINYEIQHIKHFYSIQQETFYSHDVMYDQILPELMEKYTQSICADNDEGTVIYYYFKNKLDDSHMGFIRGLFYGDDKKPTPRHPETFIVKDNYLIVFSYPQNSTIAPLLSNILKEKMK